MNDKKAYLFSDDLRKSLIDGDMSSDDWYDTINAFSTPVTTAQEFVNEVMRRADNNGDGDAHPYGIGVHFANLAKELGIPIKKYTPMFQTEAEYLIAIDTGEIDQ